MEKLMKLIVSPFEPNVKTVEDLAICIFVPCSDDFVTIKINPNIEHYAEKADTPQMKVRQVVLANDTEDTKTLRFDFADNNIHKISVDDKNYEIRLMSIGKEHQQGYAFPCFEFLISAG